MTFSYRCPVTGCEFSARDRSRFIGHMAGTMQSDPSHRWENVPVSHTDVSAARERVDADLTAFLGGAQ